MLLHNVYTMSQYRGDYSLVCHFLAIPFSFSHQFTLYSKIGLHRV